MEIFMNLKSVMCCVFAFGLSITGGAFATDLSTSNQLDEKTLMSPSAYALLVAPIKSKSVLDTHIVEAADSPLSKLSTSAQTEFSASIRFNEKGITGFRYDALAGLTATDAHEILALFGAQRATRLIDNLRIASDTDAAIMKGTFFVKGKRFDPAARNTQLKFGQWFGQWYDADDFSQGGTDHKGYYCAQRATCLQASNAICMSSC
jgi:hypothetical protein